MLPFAGYWTLPFTGYWMLLSAEYRMLSFGRFGRVERKACTQEGKNFCFCRLVRRLGAPSYYLEQLHAEGFELRKGHKAYHVRT